jgi:hypothetical protein
MDSLNGLQLDMRRLGESAQVDLFVYEHNIFRLNLVMLRDKQQPIRAALDNPRYFNVAPGWGAESDAVPMPLSLTLIVIALFVPVELSFYVVGLRLTAIRLIFLLLTPVLLVRLARKISAGRYRFVLSDLLVVLSGFWMILAPAAVDGLTEALNHAGPEVLEFCIGYMTTRILLSEHGHALSFVDLLCRVIAIVALTGLLDPLTSHYFLHDLAAGLAGAVNRLNGWDDAYRLGLLRATGPIEHPILFGFTCGIGLIIAVSSQVRWRPFVIFSCSLGTIFAFSSAPIQGIFLGFGLLVYNRMLSNVPFRWLALMCAGAAGIIAAFAISNSPLGFIISHFIYSPESGYFREWTWERVIFYVSQSPWYGLGYGLAPDEINHSIDSLWLVLAIHSGFPGAVLVALSLFGAASLPTSGRKIDLTPAESRLGTTLGIVIFLTVYVAFTVHFWGTSWILAGLLIGTRAHLGEMGHLRPRATRIPLGDAGRSKALI